MMEWENLSKHSFTIWILGIILLITYSTINFPQELEWLKNILLPLAIAFLYFGRELKGIQKAANLEVELANKSVHTHQDMVILTYNLLFSNTGDKPISVKKLFFEDKSSKNSPKGLINKFEPISIEGGKSKGYSGDFGFLNVLQNIDGKIVAIDTYNKRHSVDIFFSSDEWSHI